MGKTTLKQIIQGQYGSVSNFAARIGVHRSTLGRVLDGTYPGNTQKHINRIARQLELDNIKLDHNAIPHTQAKGLRSIEHRIDDITGSLRMVARQASGNVRSVITVACKDLQNIKGVISESSYTE